MTVLHSVPTTALIKVERPQKAITLRDFREREFPLYVSMTDACYWIQLPFGYMNLFPKDLQVKLFYRTFFHIGQLICLQDLATSILVCRIQYDSY